MAKFWVHFVVLVALAANGLSLPQGRQQIQQQQHGHLDPAVIEENMNHEHEKLIENLQRLKRTLEHVKERVGKGTMADTAKVDMKNPEGAILTVLKSLQEQGQLFSMINDMLKAGSEVQNQTAIIQEYSALEQEARAEASIADRTNQIEHVPSAVPSVAPTPAVVPTISSSTHRAGTRSDKDAAKQHGYDDYQYHYRDDARDSTGDEHYDYHYDASGYEESPKTTTTTTTTTTRRPGRRVRTRGRNDYYKK